MKQVKVKEVTIQTGIDQALVSKFESGSRVPTTEQLHLLSQCYGLDYSTLYKTYMADKIYSLLENESNANEIIALAESRLQYLTTRDHKVPLSIYPEIQSRLDNLDQLNSERRKFMHKNLVHDQKLEEHLELNYTYESNKIEGNTLTLNETMLVLKEGITIHGKSVIEHLEAINHNEAIELIHDIIYRKVRLKESILLQLHGIILRGIDRLNAGTYRSVNVRILGSSHIPPEPYLVPKMMEDYFIFYKDFADSIHPIILAAELHERLVTIHPFIDGNGRTSRLIMNFILLSHGYPIAILKGDPESRIRYFKALELVQLEADTNPFYHLIIDRLEASIKESIHLLKPSKTFQ